MCHSLSASYIKKLEKYLDLNIGILKSKIQAYTAAGQAFDLTKLLHYYVIDVLGELAFSQYFGVQEADDEFLVPPVFEHSLLAAVTGAWPAMTMTLKRGLPCVPHQGLQKLFAGRKTCADLASACVQRRLKGLEGENEEDVGTDERNDLLTKLIKAKDPETGARLSHAWGFGDGGFWIYFSFPFVRNCMRENFRITPVFTMPLARRVVDSAGITIEGDYFPQGVYARWDKPGVDAKARLLMYFGLGRRQCIGNTVAMMNNIQVVSTLLREFEFELVDGDTDERNAAGKNEKGVVVEGSPMPELVSVGISGIKGELFVRAKARSLHKSLANCQS
ncbi:cytochrome P450 [Aspergillus heterothallicus]